MNITKNAIHKIKASSVILVWPEDWPFECWVRAIRIHREQIRFVEILRKLTRKFRMRSFTAWDMGKFSPEQS